MVSQDYRITASIGAGAGPLEIRTEEGDLVIASPDSRLRFELALAIKSFVRRNEHHE